MNVPRFVLGSLLCASLAAVEPSARAFGGTAREFEREGNFVVTNNAAFALRQQLNSPTSTAFALRPALDYFIIDCAETRDGSLLIFEADSTAVVHNMDPPAIFPYKPPQMRKIFAAFSAMLERRVAAERERAA